jgi:hypothetical protein
MDFDEDVLLDRKKLFKSNNKEISVTLLPVAAIVLKKK